MSTILKIIIPIGILALGVAIMLLLFGMKEDPGKRELKVQPKMVETVVVDLDDLVTRINALGKVVSSQPVELYSEVSGVMEAGGVPFQPGQIFNKGDLLVKIDDRQAVLNLSSRKSELLSALANVLPEIKSDFEDEYPIWQDFFDKINFRDRLPDMPEPGDRKIKLFLARYNVYKNYFSALDFEIIVEKHSIRAPFDGSIVAANLRVGTSVRSGSHLGQIINLADLEVEIPVTVNDLGWVDSNGKVLFRSNELSGSWSGNIRRIGRAIDKKTQTVSMFASLANESGSYLYEGAYLNADIPGRKIKDAAAIPRRAVYDNRYVYLLSGGKLKMQDISIARIENEDVIVDGGLKDNDTLVIDMLMGVAPGMSAISRNLQGAGEIK